jgi:hypothetical protein
VKRRTVITDRLGCAVAGSALITLGVAAVAWERGELPVPQHGAVRLPWLPGATGAWWWPVALGVVAVVAVLVGVRWLVGHRPGQRLGSSALPGSGPSGHLGVDLNTVAAAAAADLEGDPHILAAKGTTLIDRGQRLIELDVTIDTSAGSLAGVVEAVGTASRDLGHALEGVPYTSRVLLRTARNRRGAARVQ